MELPKLKPDWNVAYLHGISTVPGITDVARCKKQGKICPCCMNPIEKHRAPLCENSKQLEFLGFGFPLFYIFVKYCIILIIISIASYNSIVLFWAVIASKNLCAETLEGCSSFMVSFAQISPKILNSEVVVRIFSFVIQLGMLLYIRDIISKTRSYYDERTCSLSEYSVLVRNLPQRKRIKRILAKFLSQKLDKPYEAYDITCLPEYQDYYKMEEQIHKMMSKMKQLMKNQEKNKEKIEQLQQVIGQKYNQLCEYCEYENNLQENDQLITQKLIFSCWTQDDKLAILQAVEDISEQIKRQAFYIPPQQECNIQFSTAPQPKQINWQHINYSDGKRVGRMIIGWVLTILFLAIITIIFFFLLSQKSLLLLKSFKNSDNQSYYSGLILIYACLGCVVIFNKFIMGWILHKICDFERHSTSDEQEFHFALKYSVGMFFTTALMTLAVQDLRFHNFYDHPYGVIEQETIMFILNAFFVPFLWLINPWQIMVLIKRKLNIGRRDFTQKEANKMMQNVQYNMGKRYAQIIQIMWFTFLYSSLIPLGAFLSLIGLCLYYWVDKYNLLRRSSVNSNIAGQLSIRSMKLLDFTLLCKPLGQILFDAQIRDSYCISSIAMSAIAILYLVLPISDFLNYFHPQQFKRQEKNFKQAQNIFKENYLTLHPIFSLKRQNQQKLYKSLKLQQGHQPQEESQSRFMEITSSIDKVESHINPLKDATNILRALFQKHDAFTVEIKEKFRNSKA